jgi:uncharacterized membrane protein YcaP (DUF421 family)
MFFDSGYGLLRILIVAPLIYVALVVMLRVSGKRSLSKMNAFDFVVTVALGSMLASTILTKDVALLEGILGMALLLLLQFIITWLSVRSEQVSKLVKAEPTLLFHKGRFLEANLRYTRVTPSEVHEATRVQGIGSMDDVVSVVLETDGSFSVISSLPEGQELPVGVMPRSQDR